MTDKQIIIDGVDVSGCSYYQYNMCTATKDDYGDCSLCCQDYDMNDCYYKQLKRKEQECEELKHEVELMMDCASCKVDEYKQTLAEIKEIAEPFCNACQEFEPEKSKNCINCTYCNYNKILQKISEVE